MSLWEARDDEEPTEISAFQRSNLSYVWSTNAGLPKHKILTFSFILPVDYTHAWFQESTWARIAQNRVNGRPNFDHAVVLRCEPDTQIAPATFGRENCTIIRYSHRRLVAEGGFDGADKTWLYGKFDMAAKVRAHLAEMRRDRKRRKRQRTKYRRKLRNP